MRTGAQFLDSIREDGRQVYFDGEVVKDVTSHPAFQRRGALALRGFSMSPPIRKTAR